MSIGSYINYLFEKDKFFSDEAARLQEECRVVEEELRSKQRELGDLITRRQDFSWARNVVCQALEDVLVAKKPYIIQDLTNMQFDYVYDMLIEAGIPPIKYNKKHERLLKVLTARTLSIREMIEIEDSRENPEKLPNVRASEEEFYMSSCLELPF